MISKLALLNDIYLETRKATTLLLNAENGVWLFAEGSLGRYLEKFKDGRQIDHDEFLQAILDRLIPHDGHITGIVKKDFMKKGQVDIKSKKLLVVIEITTNCNLNCSYCYKNYAYHENTIDLEKLKRVLELLFLLDYELFFLNFHGGEPLLYPDHIVSIIDFANTLGNKYQKKINYHITSNGTYLDSYIVKLINERVLSLTVSLDGTKEINDKSRLYKNGLSSYNGVCKSIEKITPEFRRVSCVVSSANDIIPAFENFVSLKIKKVKFGLNFPYLNARHRISFHLRQCQEAAKKMIIIAQKCYKLNKANKETKMIIENINYMLINMLSLKQKYMCNSSPCGAGNAILALDTKCNLYPCDIFRNKFAEEFKICDFENIGNITKMLSSSHVIQCLRNRNVDNIPECMYCQWKRFCGGGCPFETLDYFGTFNNKALFCEYYKSLCHELLWQIYYEPELAKYLIDIDR